jgi:hypothetical protein
MIAILSGVITKDPMLYALITKWPHGHYKREGVQTLCLTSEQDSSIVPILGGTSTLGSRDLDAPLSEREK